LRVAEFLVECGLARAQVKHLEAKTSERFDFVRAVWPILSRNCLGCHGKEEQETGLRLDTREAALANSEEYSAAVSLLPFSQTNLS
jgi:hypothetical protein